MSRFGNINYGTDSNISTMSAIEDNDGWLWFGTDKGLIRYDKKSKFSNYNTADGLPNQVFTLCQPVKDAEGNLWFGNSFGLTMLDFEKLKHQQSGHPGPVAVTSLTSNGRNITSRISGKDKNLSVTLSGNETNLVIYPSDFGFKPSENFIVEYRYEDSDGKWRRTNGLNPVRIYNIPEGTQKLIMRLQGDPSTETVLSITKESTFNWAIIALAAVVILDRKSVV